MTATPRRHHGQSTQRDVAREAGVSIMTVSNVINGKHRMMTKETREAVEAAIARLNYRPDSVGRGLRLSRRFSLGLLVVDPSPTFIADYFTTQVVAGLSNSLSQKGYGILIQGASSERLVDIASLRAGGTDALCVMISGAPEERRMLRERLADLNHPFVVLRIRCRKPVSMRWRSARTTRAAASCWARGPAERLPPPGVSLREPSMAGA
jgi:DNA-binding LacI/PurR family transcriptional regulator